MTIALRRCLQEEAASIAAAAQVVDMFRIPSFLGPQIDLLEAAAKAVTSSTAKVVASNTAKVVNVNNGQLLAPQRPAPAHGAGHLHWLQHPGGGLLQLYRAAGLGVRRLSMENDVETRSRPSRRAQHGAHASARGTATPANGDSPRGGGWHCFVPTVRHS